jgi:hypothetical protein
MPNRTFFIDVSTTKFDEPSQFPRWCPPADVHPGEERLPRAFTELGLCVGAPPVCVELYIHTCMQVKSSGTVPMQRRRGSQHLTMNRSMSPR